MSLERRLELNEIVLLTLKNSFNSKIMNKLSKDDIPKLGKKIKQLKKKSSRSEENFIFVLELH